MLKVRMKLKKRLTGIEQKQLQVFGLVFSLVVLLTVVMVLVNLETGDSNQKAKASGLFASVEPENGTITIPAVSQNDASASAGKYILFGQTAP